MNALSSLALVMAGGALGAGARFLVGAWLLRTLGSGFPWGTFAVNVISWSNSPASSPARRSSGVKPSAPNSVNRDNDT